MLKDIHSIRVQLDSVSCLLSLLARLIDNTFTRADWDNSVHRHTDFIVDEDESTQKRRRRKKKRSKSRKQRGEGSDDDSQAQGESSRKRRKDSDEGER